jgi:hypothetical protein
MVLLEKLVLEEIKLELMVRVFKLELVSFLQLWL